MEHQAFHYPEDGKEARKVFLGYVVLVSEALGFDKQEDRKKAVLLAKAFLNGEVSETVIRAEYERLSKFLEDSGLWNSRQSEAFHNVEFGLMLSEIDPCDEYGMSVSFDNMMIYMENIGFKTDAEYALRKDYFAKYKPKT